MLLSVDTQYLGRTDAVVSALEGTVTRTDKTDQSGDKHENCSYFVIDVDHDPHAEVALRAYAKSCRGKHPQLAQDIEGMFVNSEDVRNGYRNLCRAKAIQ